MLTVKIVAENEEERFEGIFDVYEIHNDKDYGNGNYISIYRNDNMWKCVDVRYWKGYEFKKVVDEIFKDYYGGNLREITITEVI